MFLEESPEQQELRAELRRYYAELLTDEVREGLAEGGEGGDAWREVVRQIGKDGWLGIGWPTEFGGQGRPATDQFIFFDETRRAGAPFPFVTINTVGPTIMRFGTEEQKSFFLPKILAGRAEFRHRLHRARGGHRPRLAAHPRRARRRGVRRQRGQDLHVRRRHGRLRLARHPHRPRGAEAQGHLHHLRADVGAGLRVVDHQHRRGTHHDPDLLRQRAGARRQPRRRGERGLAHDHDPAQPRARRPRRLERARHLAVRGRRGVGGDDAVRRGARRDRAAVGPDGPGQVQGRAGSHVAPELAHGGARRGR